MVAAAVIGGAVVGGVATSMAGNKAANAEEDAANKAQDTQLTMYNQTRSDQAPYRQAGYTALGQLSAGTQPGGQFDTTFNPNTVTMDPGYQFRLQQGQKGVENSAAARGMTLSGAALKGIDQYNQGFASNEYGAAYARDYNAFSNDQTNRYNRLASIAGLGQTATAQTSAAGSTAANQISGAQIGAGNAAAAGSIATGNAISGAGTTLGNYYLQQQYMTPSSYAPGNGTSFNASSYGDGTMTAGGNASGAGAYTLTGINPYG